MTSTTRLRRGAAATVAGLLVAVGVLGVAYGSTPQQQTAPPPLACTGQIDPVAGGTLRCVPAGPTTSPKPTPSATPSATIPAATTPAPTTPAPTASTPKPSPSTTTPTATTTPTVGQGRTMSAYLTGYSFWDNTPPGSADISHPWAGRDAEHRGKAAGTGTYANPITVAVGHSIIGGKDVLDWPAGTRFYIPSLHRYFLVEDTCGDGSKPQNGPCHTGYPSGASTWLDVWVDGQSAGRDVSDDCMSELTGVVTAIVDPPSNLPVTAGPISSAEGCG